MSSTSPAIDRDELEAVNAEVLRIQRHQEAGRLDDADRAIDTLLAKYVNHPQLMHLKALNLLHQGNTTDGFAMLQLVVDNDRENVMALTDYGSFLARQGRIDEAISKFQLAVDTAPNFALGLANLGAAQLVKERYEPAIENLTKALSLEGSLVDAHLNLAQAFIRTRRFERAIDPLFRVLALDPNAVAAHVNLAHALFRAERHEAAEHHARRALELAPGAIEPTIHLGTILGAMGRMDEAVDTLTRAAQHVPQGQQALWRLVNLRKVTPDSPVLELLGQYETILAQADAEQRANLHFALGKVHEDLGEFDTAITHFRTGNDLTAERVTFDAQNHADQHERMRALVSPAFISEHRGAGLRDIAPVFICGMPRSGTTLMDQMFSRHSQVQAGGELRAVGHAFGHSTALRKVLQSETLDTNVSDDMLTAFAERYVDYLHREGLKSEYVSDKMPNNYLYGGLLALAFPRAKILIMRRHPMDCLLSNYVQNFGQNQPFATKFETLAAVYREFDETAHHLLRTLPEQVRFVQYEDVVADPEAQMRAVTDFIGLPFEAEMLDHTASLRAVNTASVSQVRAPIYGSSVGKWQRYGPLVRDLAAHLGDFLSDEDKAAAGL